MSLKKRPPKLCLNKATGRAFVQWKRHRTYLGKYGSPEALEGYKRWVAEHWTKPEEPESSAHVPADLTILELVDRFWVYAEQHYRRDGEPTLTLKKLRPALARILELYGSTPAAEFGPLALKALRNTWVNDGLARITVNYYTATIKQVFTWAVSEQLIAATMEVALKTVKGLQAGRTKAYDPAPIGPVADAIVDATLPHVPAIVADMIRIQRLTGARPGEMRMMRACDVHRFESEDRALPLFDVDGRDPPPRELKVWRYIPSRHKTEHHGRKRVVFIGPRAQEILRPYLLRLAFTPDALCFLTARDGMYSKDMYNRLIIRGCEIAFSMPQTIRERAIRKLRQQLKAPDLSVEKIAQIEQEAAELEAQAAAWRARHCWSPNQLRHTAATAIRQRYDAEASQVVLGHADLKTTEIYAERDQAKAAAIMQEVG